jgi:cobalt-zinc-cadmium efflux system membrane fusion protein
VKSGRCGIIPLPLVLLGLIAAACGGGEPPAEGPEQPHDGGTVVLTPEQVQNAAIETAVVEFRPATGVIEATAVVEGVPDRTARIGSRVEGRVVWTGANVGDTVRAGAALARIDSPELGRAKADYLAAHAVAEVARQTAEREARLYQERISSEREWREAEAEATRAVAERDAAEARLHALGLTDDDLGALSSERHYSSTFDVRTPTGGIVTERQAALGATVAPTDVLFTVMDLRTVWVQVDAYDEQFVGLRVGQVVHARTRAYPDRVFSGRIDNIGAVLDPATRAVKVRVVLPNPDGALKPGMFADVDIEVTHGSRDSVLAVPAGAVQDDAGQTIVFVARGGGRFERRVIEAGTAGHDWVPVRRGLTSGELVVVRGAFILKSELRKGELGEEGH